MKFLFKSFLYVAVVAVGGYFAVNNIPYLKANIMEVVNPQVKESRLVRELGANIDELNTTLSQNAGPTSATVVAKSKQLVQDSQKLVSQINALNDAHPGVVSAVVAKVADVVMGSSGSHSSTSTATLTPTPPPPSPCVPQ